MRCICNAYPYYKLSHTGSEVPPRMIEPSMHTALTASDLPMRIAAK